MPATQRAKENNPTVVPFKSLSKEQMAQFAQQFRRGQLVPATLSTTDDGSQVVRPVLTQLAQ